MWFGLEPLPLGRHDFSQLPTLEEGVHFGPFVEGRPGMQPERLPPYCSTLNPGWNPALPLYKPLPMFDAMKAALDPRGPQPCAWDRYARSPVRPDLATTATVERVAFIGDRAGNLAHRLSAWGVPIVAEGDSEFVIVDADTLLPSEVGQARRTLDTLLASGGVVLVMAGGGTRSSALSGLLPIEARLTDRPATALVPDCEHPWTRGLTLSRLYFAADGVDRFIMRHGAEGAFVARGRVLLRASETDWSLFNNVPEVVKTGAVTLYEQLDKPSGAALVELAARNGKVVLCTLDYRIATRAADGMWRNLLAGMGIHLAAGRESLTPAFSGEWAWINALSIGRFGAPDMATAADTDFVDPAGAFPRGGVKAGDCAWAPVTSPSRDRFVFRELKQTGSQEAFAVYFSCWVKSPRDLDDLLTGGPDTPHVTVLCYVSERGRFYVNGREVMPVREEQVDYRTLLRFEDVPLKRGWNRLLFKVASSRLEGDEPGTLAVRVLCNRSDFLRQMETAVEIKADSQ